MVTEVLAAAGEERGDESLPLLEQHARLQERELALDLVGHCCVLLGALGRGGEESGAAGGSDALQVGLRLSLLSVLEQLGDSAALVAEAAERALCRMSLAQGRGEGATVAALIEANGDFLLEALSRRLRHQPSGRSRVPLVMEALLSYAGATTLPLLADVVGELIDLADEAVGAADGESRAAPALLPCARAMCALVLAARDCQAADETAASGEGAAAPEGAAVAAAGVSSAVGAAESVGGLAVPGSGEGEGDEAGNELAAMFDSFWSEVAPAEARGGEPGGGEEAAAEGEGPEGQEEAAARREAEVREEEEEEERRNKPPMAPALALRVVQKVEMLLLCSPPSVAHVLLDALAAAIPLLQPWPRALLPALHKLWAPLISLFDSPELALAAAAMGVLCTAAHLLRGELSVSSMAAAFPPVLRVVAAHGAAPPLTQLRPAGGQAAAEPRSRPQDALLAALGVLRALCRVPRAATARVVVVMTAIEPLLSSRQPERVRTEAAALAADLAGLQRDALWLFCARATAPADLGRSAPNGLPWLSLPPEAAPPLPGPRHEFAQAAKELLRHIEGEDVRARRRAMCCC